MKIATASPLNFEKLNKNVWNKAKTEEDNLKKKKNYYIYNFHDYLIFMFRHIYNYNISKFVIFSKHSPQPLTILFCLLIPPPFFFWKGDLRLSNVDANVHFLIPNDQTQAINTIIKTRSKCYITTNLVSSSSHIAQDERIDY